MNTFRDLKAKIDTLTDAQLDMPTRWAGDEIGGDSVTLSVLSEEFIMTEDGYTPVSAFGSPEEIASIRAEFSGEKPWPAGMPLLSVEVTDG